MEEGRRRRVKRAPEIVTFPFEELITERKKPRRSRSRAFCTCKNTKCLKKYCVCFAAGHLCGSSCACVDCHNASTQQARRETENNKFLIASSLASLPPKVGVPSFFRRRPMKRLFSIRDGVVFGEAAREAAPPSLADLWYDDEIPCEDSLQGRESADSLDVRAAISDPLDMRA